MKRLLATVLIIGVVVFGLETTFSKAETKTTKPAAKVETEKSKPVGKAGKTAPAVAEANKIADVNQAAEPNEAEEVEKGFEKASKAADQEYKEVTRQSTENRVKMMEAMQKQAVSELEFIRSLAVQEGATKTVKAVDLAIEKRKERYVEMIQNVKERQEREALRSERAKERPDKERKRRTTKVETFL